MKIKLTILLICIISNSLAKDKIIDFNQNKGLKPDEGLVVLILKMNFRITKVSIAKKGKVFPVYSFKKPRPGTQIKIIKLKAGSYYWKEGLGYSGQYKFELDMDKERTGFEVKAGKLNYPGMLELKASATSSESSILYGYNVINNSTSVYEYLKKSYSTLLAKYKLVYSGKNPDPFLEFSDKLDKQ